MASGVAARARCLRGGSGGAHRRRPLSHRFVMLFPTFLWSFRHGRRGSDDDNLFGNTVAGLHTRDLRVRIAVAFLLFMIYFFVSLVLYIFANGFKYRAVIAFNWWVQVRSFENVVN